MSISFIRTILMFLGVIIALRLMGKRQIGELEPSELVITILVSELAAVPIQDLNIPLLSGLIPMMTLIALEIITSFLSLKSITFRRILNGNSAVIIRNGKLDARKMREIRVNIDEVLETLRENNIGCISEVKYAVIESSGKLSYVLKAPYRPVTADMLGLTPEDSGIPLIVISDGKIIKRNLDMIGKSIDELMKEIKKHNTENIQDVFLMTIDDCDNVFIQKKEGL